MTKATRWAWIISMVAVSGAGLVVIDVVTCRGGNPHDEVVALLGLAPECRLATPTGLSAVSYHPMGPPRGGEVAVWFEPLAVGTPLPVMPLAVREYGFVPIDLEATYTEACQRSLLV